MGVQSFIPTGSACITQILTSGPDSLGYVYLIGVASNSETQAFFRTRWKGTFVQSFSPTSGCLRGFLAESDTLGYIYLKAFTDSDTGYILKSAYVGTYVQSFDASPCYIRGFSAKSDTGGFAVLSADTICGIVSYSEDFTPINSLKILSINNDRRGVLIKYTVPRYGRVVLSIYTPSGRKIYQRVSTRHVGIYRERVELPSGVYIISLKEGKDKVIQKFVRLGK